MGPARFLVLLAHGVTIIVIVEPEQIVVVKEKRIDLIQGSPAESASSLKYIQRQSGQRRYWTLFFASLNVAISSIASR